MRQADYQRAAELFDEGVRACRERGHKWLHGWTLAQMGIMAWFRGDDEQGHYDQATASFRDSLILCGQAGNRWISEECLEGLARVASARGHYERAARLFGSAEAQREVIGYRFAPLDQPHHDRSVASARAALGEATFVAAWEGYPPAQVWDGLHLWGMVVGVG